MIIEIKIPTPGESITEVEIASWLVENGAIVEKDQDLAEIESDKATLMLTAEEAGEIKIIAPANEPVKVGNVACTIDTEKVADKSKIPEEKKPADEKKTPIKNEPKTTHKEVPSDLKNVKVTPLADKIMSENNISVDDIISGLKRIDKNTVTRTIQKHSTKNELSSTYERTSERKKMSSLRRKISERLVAVKNETAMLTTFNEVDMLAVMELRKKHQKKFEAKHGIKLGFMSFFTKAASIALQEFSEVNAMIDGNEIIHFSYTDIGIAVQTPKGLMVPVIRDASELSLVQLEMAIENMAKKARDGKISIDDLQGGTFSITNGGVFGSLLSTPIINPPQAAILGMHNIQDRPVAVNGAVVIRPMMYLALSYDHRVIDGKSSVGFLKTIKELIENPIALLTGGNAYDKLLDL